MEYLQQWSQTHDRDKYVTRGIKVYYISVHKGLYALQIRVR